jgi:hypothetical protein
MPESRKRPGHHDYKKPSSIPSRQRTKGRTIWAVLFAVFAVMFAYFAGGANYILLAVVAVIGGLAGYAVGKSMEKDAAH